MSPKAVLILLVLFLLMLPILTTDHSSAQHPTATVTAVAEATAEVTQSVVVPTAEVTLEATLEAILEPANTMLVGDPARGDVIFHQGLNNAPACINCHSTTTSGKQGFALGPGLKGIGEIAATRIEGMTAVQYIEDSIRNPNDYLVGGFRGIMYTSFGVDYTDQDITDLVAYLLAL